MTIGNQATFRKQPTEIKPWVFDLTDLFSNRPDTPASVSVTALGLTATSNLVGMQVQVTVSGGVDTGNYDGRVLVTTSLGMVEEIDFRVEVRETPPSFNSPAETGTASNYATQAAASALAADNSADSAAASAAAAAADVALLGDALAINPANHGAVGDGVTDDWAALQAAINAAMASGTSVGYLTGLGKTYAISKQLVLSGAFDVTMEDFKLKAITGTWPAGDDGAMVKVTRPTNDATARCRLSRITLNANSIAPGGVLVSSAGAGTVLDTVRAVYYTEYGIALKATGNGNNDIKLVKCTAHEVTSGMTPKTNTLSARTAVGFLIDASADVELLGCTGAFNKINLHIKNIWNCSVAACKFWSGPVREDAGAITVLLDATANRVQFTGCRFDDGAVKLYSFNHSFTGCNFIQFSHGLVQLVATLANETAAKLTMVGNTIENAAVSLLTEGVGTWAGVQAEFVANRRSTGADVLLQDCTTITGALRLRGEGQLQLGNTSNLWLPSSNGTTPAISAHGTTAKASQGVGRWSADANGALVDLFKSYGTSVGGYAAIPTGTTIGEIRFSGAFGTTTADVGRGALLRAEATTNWTNGNRSTRLVLATNNSNSPTDRWEMSQDGHWLPLAPNVYDVGSAVNGVRTGYFNQLLIGYGQSVTTAYGSKPFVQTHSTHASDGGYSATRWSSTAGMGGVFTTVRSLSDTLGTYAALSGGQFLGRYGFAGDNGTNTNQLGAAIAATAVGAWSGTSNGGKLWFYTAPSGSTSLTARWSIGDTGVLEPAADNTYSAGSASLRISTVYAATASINTSDARTKTAVQVMSQAEMHAAKDLAREIGVFKFLDAVALKGDAARKHIGMTVQRAIEIMGTHGLDPFGYGFICHDAWAASPAVLNEDGSVAAPAREAGDLYSFRSEELLFFIARGFETRLSALEAAAA